MQKIFKMPQNELHNQQSWYNRIITGDARTVLKTLPRNKIDLSFWSPPYYVGKSYEDDMSFEDWQKLMSDVIAFHTDVLKPGGFMVVNIGDILCFADPNMPRIQADSISRKKSPVTKKEILEIKKSKPNANRHELAKILGCSEQTIQRRLEDNNVRGGKSSVGTKVQMTGAMVWRWAESAGLYLYDKRIWHKDPAWMNSRWHPISYKAIDEYENILVFWKPGITTYDRSRLTEKEWSEWGSRGVWHISSVRKNQRHEAEFPEELARRVIRIFSPRRGVVLDPFVGTGTTTYIARNEGRKWIGIDKSKRCAKLAERRTNGT